MMDISYANLSVTTGQAKYQSVNQNKKSPSNDAFRRKMSNGDIYIKAPPKKSWAEVDKIPCKYALKSEGAISWHWHAPGAEYRFYHAAESTDENPVIVARGVDEHGKFFEEKIDVRKIDPYDTNILELQALERFKPGDFKSINYYLGADLPEIQERFDFIAGIQEMIEACKELRLTEQVTMDKEDMDFVLSFTGSTARPYRHTVNKKNLELYSRAARERMAAGMAKKCSKEFLDEFWEK